MVDFKGPRVAPGGSKQDVGRQLQRNQCFCLIPGDFSGKKELRSIRMEPQFYFGRQLQRSQWSSGGPFGTFGSTVGAFGSIGQHSHVTQISLGQAFAPISMALRGPLEPLKTLGSIHMKSRDHFGR